MQKIDQEICTELQIELFDSLMSCGLIVTELYPDYRIVYANALLLKMLGYQTLEEMTLALHHSALSFVAEHDLERVQEKGALRQGHGVYELSYHIVSKSGTARFVLQRSRHHVLHDGREIIVATYHDAEESSLQDRQRLEKDQLDSVQQAALAEQKLQVAIENSNLAVWEFFFAERKIVTSTQTAAKFHAQTVIEHVPDSLSALDAIHPESLKHLQGMYESLLCGGDHAQGEIAILYNGEMQWFNIQMTTLYRNGLPTSAICTAVDITREKTLILQMEDEISRREVYESRLRGKGYYDLTEDRVLEYDTRRLINRKLDTLTRYSDAVQTVMEQIPDETERRGFHDLFCPKNLLSQFGNGSRQVNYEYRRLVPEGGVSWVNTWIQLLRQPRNGHTVAFMYTTDINEQKQGQLILQSIIYDNYDGIALVNVENARYHFFSCTDDALAQLSKSGTNFWEEMPKYLKTVLPEEEWPAEMEKRDPARILALLEHQPSYMLTNRIKAADGRPKTVRVQYSYGNGQRQWLVVTSMDITTAMEEEKKQKELLEAALLSAKQASSAKSDFLSRMSHEIRTPLNAILGMSALATQSIGNDAEVLDYISKIGISGHYLLSLINDILDMSRIESRKMLLHNTAFNFSEFIDGITTVIYGQAVNKGIQYETEVSHGLEDGYIGDAMKLQQILINILGNAVKFTPKGGKITFSISLISRTEEEARIRFAVNDTGCGISEDALTRIFDPFEQQDSSTTSFFGGSGLGLAIAKNLVVLLGGTIHVRSIVNIGSEFTVEVPLTIDPSLASKRASHYSFADLHTLIVDDDLIICEQTSQTLREIGMIPEWVTSGTEAIARVKERWNKRQCYDFILVDWKMPDLDGIETSRRIRRIVGPNVTIIIITAYDWASIEQEAKAAGVNMCISKPMLRSTLVSAFTRATGEVERERTQTEQLEIDFTGRRILLAEDHPLNAEITTKLLAKKNCVVDVADNGLKAMECFANTPAGYYDAILMDIRMPLMDGLQAATNIRHWDKEDAKTIPIIAMTANAFDEDVERSKNAGMDAHLAKPIDPDLLYHVLYRLIK